MSVRFRRLGPTHLDKKVSLMALYNFVRLHRPSTKSIVVVPLTSPVTEKNAERVVSQFVRDYYREGWEPVKLLIDHNSGE